MHMTKSETIVLANQLKSSLAQAGDVEIVVCPPFTALDEACDRLMGTGIQVGGQNLHWGDKGAYTGEVSAPMLKDLGCTHVIIGHSERRTLFGETDADTNKKLKAALQHGLIPILCIGESLEQREQGITEDICFGQLNGGLEGIDAGELENIIIAYEPIWAIGTGLTATPDDAQGVIGAIRSHLASKYNDVAAKVRILYGGSVKSDNIDGLMEKPDIDGALVGGASLDAQGFARIVNFGG